MWKGNCYQPGILCLAKLSFKINVDTNILSNKQNLGEFITSRPEIQLLKRVFEVEEKGSKTWK